MHLRAAIKSISAGAALAAVLAGPARADEGGISFWLPGQMGSLAAVPGEAGWSMPVLYVHTSAKGGRDAAFTRGGRVALGLKARADLVLAVPTYTFEKPVWGAQAAVGMGIGGAHMKTNIQATVTGPGGGQVSGSEHDSLNGAADLYPTASLKWNRGVHNFMAYTMGGIPVGAYTAGRLANVGVNHWSLDAGGGYTYFDKKNEFSAVLGFTHNWRNKDTDYKNGTSMHLDWAASHFVSQQVFVGAVGYFYHQLTGDSGSGAKLGEFKSQVTAIGPQLGYFFDWGGRKMYLNLKAYKEFDAKNRAEGWNAWATLLVPLGK